MRITIGLLERIQDMAGKRRALAREVEALRRQENQLRGHVEEHAREKGGKFSRGPFHVAITEEDGRINWKDEFIRIAGAEAAEQLERPKVEKLVISRAA